MGIQRWKADDQKRMGFPDDEWMVTEGDHLTALARQREGIAADLESWAKEFSKGDGAGRTWLMSAAERVRAYAGEGEATP